MTKNEYIELISQNPGVGERLIYSDNWRDNITKLLLETIGTNNQNSNKITFQQKSEFAKNKIWPSFDQFMNEVRAVYSGEANVRDWYKQERQNHPLWPSQPNQTYKDQGWIGFPELVGKENRLKKEYPSFAEFMNEVRAIYTGEVGISNWYHQQRKIHPLWPAEPNKAYKDQGWIGWPELVGKENRYKEWLSFVEFQADVSRHYKGVAEVQKWYTQEQKIHPLWPSQPNQTYKDQGWIGFPELVGKESPYKEWPSFDVFMNEVRAVYSGQGGVQRWYKQEQKKHPTWPSNPDKKYKDQGWEGYGALVGRE